jgi:hypothetical protein
MNSQLEYPCGLNSTKPNIPNVTVSVVHAPYFGRQGKAVEKVSEQLLEKSWSVKGSLSVFDPAFKAFQEWLRQGSKKL